MEGTEILENLWLCETLRGNAGEMRRLEGGITENHGGHGGAQSDASGYATERGKMGRGWARMGRMNAEHGGHGGAQSDASGYAKAGVGMGRG